MKLLVVNLQNPDQTSYRNPKYIGSFMLGRHLSNYSIFAVGDDGTMKQIVFESADVMKMQEKVIETLEELAQQNSTDAL
jgi:hypothetical protein